jgi:hypothetical protein
VAQVVESLPRKYEALSSNSSIIKKEREIIRAGGMAQVVQHLSSKYKTLSFYLNTTKTKTDY